MAKAIIELRDVKKIFEDEVVVNEINLTINENEFVTLLGPSGCGKTTTLRMIGGFATPDSGEIILNGKIVNDLPPYVRPINTVFQRYALFPHLNVFNNVAFGLANKKRRFQLEFFGLDKELKQKRYEKLKAAGKIDLNKLAECQKAMDDLQKQITEKENMAKKNMTEDIWQELIELKASYNELKANAPIWENVRLNYFEMRSKRAEIKEKIAEEVRRVLKLVKLENFEERKVNQMSGGQQQRIAIARALINKPKILLLDEPLAALDLKLRQNMQYELKEMQRHLGITFIFVTHDQEEAMTMSDRIVVMEKGNIVQVGSPTKVYNEPVNRYVANFIGETNIISGTFLGDNKVKFMDTTFDIIGYDFKAGEEVDVVIRPEDWDVVPLEKAKLVGTVTSSVFKGVHYELIVVINGKEFLVNTYENIKTNESVGLKVDPYEIHLMKVEKNEELK